MHYECDYRREVEQEWNELMKKVESISASDNTPEDSALKKEHFARILEISKLKESQYIKVPNEKKVIAMKFAYTQFEEAASILGGKVVLDIDEEKSTASISYTGKELYDSDVKKDYLSDSIKTLLEYFPNIWIKAEGDEFTLTISGALYDMKQVQDLSELIQKKTKELRQWTREHCVFHK